VDPDKADIFAHYKQVVPIKMPDQLIICEGEWKKDDRQYFGDHFEAKFRTRPVTEEERKIPFEIAQRTRQSVYQPNHKNYPFFKNVLVCNISPGCRIKMSIDKLSRTPDNVVVLSGLQIMPFMPPAPIFQHAQDYIERTFACWVDALRLYAREESRTREDNPGKG
jgi:hypothetical protein